MTINKEKIIVRKDLIKGLFTFACPTHGVMTFSKEELVLDFMKKHKYPFIIKENEKGINSFLLG